ncbi:hypothetical protein CAEBREN_09223 [Caenorhabditis brenneri]|uniref:Uncharacterized protein n=1 Tax=Caenorhabditis brenneri TaxID=135651 RepID=G0NNM5_CAEBE|nr:hypothetical protein CAEBREN_09223 [Caenorhabditis brenneri]
MNTVQGQRLHPVQETGNEKAEPLLSIRKISIDHFMDVKIDSSRLVMVNGNSPIGFIENIFTRFTQRMVFEFLGGHVKMEELPCLGDFADGNDEFHRTTPSPTFSKSNQFKLLDATGNLHLSSILFIDSDFNPRIEVYLCESVLLDSFDASSITFISSVEHFRPELISQSADHNIEETYQCSPIDSLLVPKTIAGLMTESSSESEFFESQVSMESDGFPNGIDFMSASFRVSSNQSDKENSKNPVSKTAYPVDGANIFDILIRVESEIHNASVNASIIHSTSDGDSMSNSSNTELLDTHSPTVVDLSSFDVSDHEELLESYGFNNQDQTTDVGCTCASPSWPGKVDAAWKEAIQMNLTDLTSNKDSLSSFYDENFKNSVSSTDLEQMKSAFNTSSSPYSSEDYSSQGHLIDDGFQSSTEEPIIGTAKKSSVYAVPDPNTLGDFLFGNLDSPTFLAAELQDIKLDILDNSSAFPFDPSDYDELLESYGLNEQDQYNDDFICESPMWPGKA